MRYIGCNALFVGAMLWSLSLSGCGYLPSEMEGDIKTDKSKASEAATVVSMHTASCDTPAKGYKLVSFGELYAFTDNPHQPFQPAANLPAKYDVRAYLWGYDNCMAKGTCKHGDHYWLIKRGPEDDFATWVVTPQYPRITIASRCKNHLKVGKRYRLSFENGKLVGLSRN